MIRYMSREASNQVPQDPHGIGLYVHIPFCDSKCGYCDFYSVAVEGRDTESFVARLVQELTTRTAGYRDRIRTVFFGGGTPTILSCSELERVLSATREAVTVDQLAEFTVEANPATVDEQKARLLVERGVTRVSMGAQSFFPSELATLERLHSPEDISPSVKTLRAAGVGQINLDLIFGVPGQTMATWSQSLARAIDLGVDHIACYGLTYEPNTKLTAMKHHGRIMPCDEDLEADMFLHTMDVLGAAGFEQYEISNYAKPGRESQHNLIYWRNEPYIGVGPSAVGCVENRRYKNVPDVGAYGRLIDQRGEAEAEAELVDESMLVIEIIMMQLRLNEGISLTRFRERTGLDPLVILQPALEELSGRGLLTVSESAIAMTREGRLLANRVIGELVEACDVRASRSRDEISLPILAQ